MDTQGDEGGEKQDRPTVDGVEKNGMDNPASSLVGDITFKEPAGRFEILYSDRLADDFGELVDQSADWLENEMGVLNLGQIDHNILIADGILTDTIKNGLIAWWTERIEDLDLE